MIIQVVQIYSWIGIYSTKNLAQTAKSCIYSPKVLFPKAVRKDIPKPLLASRSWLLLFMITFCRTKYHLYHAISLKTVERLIFTMSLLCHTHLGSCLGFATSIGILIIFPLWLFCKQISQTCEVSDCVQQESQWCEIERCSSENEQYWQHKCGDVKSQNAGNFKPTKISLVCCGAMILPQEGIILNFQLEDRALEWRVALKFSSSSLSLQSKLLLPLERFLRNGSLNTIMTNPQYLLARDSWIAHECTGKSGEPFIWILLFPTPNIVYLQILLKKV